MWSLSPGMHHLNHGSFGAVPVEVQARQTEWRSRWEANTTAFIMNDLMDALNEARLELGAFVGAESEGLVFVRNASQAVASVVQSIEPTLEDGDEIVTTTHEYNAVLQTLHFTADGSGARVVVADVPFPIGSPEEAFDVVVSAVTEKTRLVVVDHITSATGLIFPIERLIAELEPDIPVLVDGAHGPGQVPLALDDLGASWYTGNLHKWVCAPKGAAFLQTREDKRETTYPTVISHAWNTPIVDGSTRYQGLFDWTGTDDMTPWLVVPDAIRVVGESDPGGWPAIMKRNNELAMGARKVMLDTLELEAPAPAEMVGSMVALPIGDGKGPDPGGLLSPLNQTLVDEGFETLVTVWPEWPKQVLRVSAYLYNELEEYRSLAETVRRLEA